MKQWKREYKLVAGPRGSEGFKIESGGASRPLHLSFDFEKSDTQSSNTGKITVSNLSDEHKAILEKKDCYIEFYAGYGNELGLIFAGGVSTTTEDMSSADRDLEIEVIDGFSTNDLPGWLSLNGVVTCAEVLSKITEEMELESAVITDAAAEKLESAKYDNGYSYVGKLRAALQNVLRKAGCTYSIQNGILQVYVHGEAVTPKAYSLSADTGLIKIPRKITISESNSSTGSSSSSSSSKSSSSSSSSSSSKKSTSSGTTSKGIPGYEVDFFLNPAIGVNDLVVLSSKSVSGYFRVHKITIKGDNYSGDWLCTAQLVEVKAS